MWSIVWRIACSCIVQYANCEWNDQIRHMNTIDKYKNIRILLLSCYLMELLMKDDCLSLTLTLNVSQAHPHISENVEMYKVFILSQYK